MGELKDGVFDLAVEVFQELCDYFRVHVHQLRLSIIIRHRLEAQKEASLASVDDQRRENLNHLEVFEIPQLV
jgi:hypothetical protein